MKDKYLKNLSKSPLVYMLNTEDVQNVAKENIGRELTHEEIKKIIEPISKNIGWTDAINIAIDQHIKSSEV